MIPVNVVTGFLGSGKTTLLREVLRRPEFADTAVIVNEFGEVGLDHLLLEGVEEGVLLLDSGCICCTIRSDLQRTIRDLHDRAAAGRIPRFRRVVVETTGLADPAPIVTTIAAEPVIRNHYRIGNIVCTVDGVNGARTLATHGEAAKQAAVADRLLVTKADLVGEEALGALEGRLAALNPLALRSRGTGAGFDAAGLFADDLGAESSRGAEVARWVAASGHGHTDGTASFVIEAEGPLDWTAFGVWLTALLHAHGDKVLRVKGLLEVAESETPVAIHGVQHVVHPPLHLARWPEGARGSRIVFITRGLEPERVKRSFSAFLGREVAVPA